MSYALESGATDSSNRPRVIVENPAGAGAVNIQDGGNSITIDSPTLTNGTQKTQVVGPAGDVAAVDAFGVLSVNVTNPQGGGGVNVAFNHLDVADNSSTSNINAGATFTGLSTSTRGYGAIVLMFSSDRDCTVHILQSHDGTNWDIDDSYPYYANVDNFAVQSTVVGDFFKVSVTNISPSNTTHLRLASMLHPVGEVLPQSLDSRGSLKVGITSLKDQFGFNGSFTPIGDLKTCEPYRLVGTVFGSATDTRFWTASNSGAGSAAGAANGIATLTSGTANSGFGQITTVRSARFIFANPNFFRSLTRVTSVAVANCTRRWGAFTISGQAPQDGFFFEVSPAGALSINTVKGGSVTSVASGSFNGLLKEYSMDTNMHAYEIVYFMADAHFYIDGVLIHKVNPTTSPMSNTITVPVTATVINSASGTTSGTLELWAGTIERLGRDLSQPTSFFQSGTTTGVQLKLGAGTLHSVTLDAIVNNAVVTLYDATSATNTIWTSGAMTAQTQPFTVDLSRIPFFTGLFLVISAANANALVVYE